MFRFFKKKSYSLSAPIDGTILSLDEVEDPIFSQRMMGDGIAIAASGNLVCAPADGLVTVTIEARHAFGMCLDNGMELIVHAGINTDADRKDAFEILIQENEPVKTGTPIIRIHREQGDDSVLITPLIITNPECFQLIDCHIGENVTAGISSAIDYIPQ